MRSVARQRLMDLACLSVVPFMQEEDEQTRNSLAQFQHNETPAFYPLFVHLLEEYELGVFPPCDRLHLLHLLLRKREMKTRFYFSVFNLGKGLQN